MVISVVGKHPLDPPRRTKIPPIRLRSGHALTRHGAMPGVGRRAASAIAFGEGGKRFLTIFFECQALTITSKYGMNVSIRTVNK